MAKTAKSAADYILPLYMSGLSGRMLYMPSQKKKGRDILFVYGQHSSLERWWGIAQVLNDYGAVTMPDLPGFGGMTSLYKIGGKPDIDSLADYLAAYFKWRYKNKKRVTIVGMSLGLLITTRMLQRYPQLAKKVDLVVSVVGFTHNEDFVYSRRRKLLFRFTCRLLAQRVFGWMHRNLMIRRRILTRFYRNHEKYTGKENEEFRKTIDAEIILWRINDFRTQMISNVEMLKVDLTKQRIDLPIIHVSPKHDRYFNHVRVEEHLRRIYKDYKVFATDNPNHAPTIMADKDEAKVFIPPGLRRIMARK